MKPPDGQKKAPGELGGRTGGKEKALSGVSRCFVAQADTSGARGQAGKRATEARAEPEPEARPAGATASRGGEAAFPCLNSNNCTENAEKAFPTRADVDHLMRVFDLSGYSRKSLFVLAENVRSFIDYHGENTCGFLTVTFPKNIQDVREAQRRYHSIRTHVLEPLFPAYIVVIEKQVRGAWHYHLLVSADRDIRTGFDFAAVAGGDYRSASPYLRQLWKVLREEAPKYGFGRTELLPLKAKNAIAAYVGKYLAKDLRVKDLCGEKGMKSLGEPVRLRRVRYSQDKAGQWHRAARHGFAWHSDGGKAWRGVVALIAEAAGCGDLEGLRARFGKKWAYHLRELLKGLPEAGKDLSGGELAKGLFARTSRTALRDLLADCERG